MAILNYGPAHPAVHGALRLILDVDGEDINNITPDIGYMHRGIEKLIEQHTYPEALQYLDRVDYVNSASQEYSYVLAVEKLLGLQPPERAKYIRVLIAELTRIVNHLLHVNMLTYDAGALSPFVWAMEEREKIMWLFEGICGARLHLNYFRVGGVDKDITDESLNNILNWLPHVRELIDDIENVITNSQIFIDRTRDVGVITKDLALAYGVTGSSLRASGIEWDLRRKCPYDVYDKMDFQIPIRTQGDCYDRYLVKMHEMRESTKIIEQCITAMPEGDFIASDKRYCPPKDMKHGDIMFHVKHYQNGFTVPPGTVYVATESPKGEFGIFLVSDGSNKPLRCHIRSTGFPLMTLIKKIVNKMADLPVVLASLDIVLGEVDR